MSDSLLSIDPSSNWLIDTDPGIDDSFALMLALRIKSLNIVGISIEAGNSGIDNCYINAKKIVALSERYVPIFKGTTQCLTSSKSKNAEHVHGSDGLNDMSEFNHFLEKYDELERKEIGYNSSGFAPFKIIELSHIYKNFCLFCIGPLTNLAVAYMIDPTLPSRISKLVIMGGSYKSRGNIEPNVEFNFYFDPLAAKLVFNHFDNIILYPWEADELHFLYLNDIDDQVENHKDRTLFCKNCIQRKMDYNKSENADFPDYGAAIAAFIPNAIKKYSIVNSDIIIDSLSEVNGQLVTSKSAGNHFEGRKIILIEELNQEVFTNEFKKMIR